MERVQSLASLWELLSTKNLGIEEGRVYKQVICEILFILIERYSTEKFLSNFNVIGYCTQN